jgi:hypothetical protein
MRHIETHVGDIHLAQLALIIACGIVAVSLWPRSRLKLSSALRIERMLSSRNPFLAAIAIEAWSLTTGLLNSFSTYFFGSKPACRLCR